MDSEADLLASARRYSFRARMDAGQVSGPVFVFGSGSEVEDVGGKRYLDFNSWQMCAALGHNHPTVTAASKQVHALGQAVHRYCFERGLIFSQRRQGSVLRFVPPMTTSEAQLDRAAQLLDDAFAPSLG
jgi:4-aminobutyrate aminotransferase-like enzyme